MGINKKLKMKNYFGLIALSSAILASSTAAKHRGLNKLVQTKLNADLDCPVGTYWDKDECLCVSEIKCALFCEEPLIAHPVHGCSCLTEEEYDDLFWWNNCPVA